MQDSDWPHSATTTCYSAPAKFCEPCHCSIIFGIKAKQVSHTSLFLDFFGSFQCSCSERGTIYLKINTICRGSTHASLHFAAKYATYLKNEEIRKKRIWKNTKRVQSKGTRLRISTTCCENRTVKLSKSSILSY